jgi:hypothetical protein
MAVTPPAGGGGGTSWAQQVQSYGAQLNAQYPPGPSGATGKGPVVNLGADYIAYMNAHKSDDPATIYESVLAGIASLKGVPTAIGTAISAGATAAAGLGAAGAGSLSAISPIPKFSLGVTGIAGWFVRGLKVLVGGILMILAISHLTGASNKVTALAGKAIPLAAAA